MINTESSEAVNPVISKTFDKNIEPLSIEQQP